MSNDSIPKRLTLNDVMKIALAQGGGPVPQKHSFTAAWSIRSLAAGQCLESFQSTFNQLNDEDKKDVAFAVLSNPKIQRHASLMKEAQTRSAESRPPGRPRGAMGRETEWRNKVAAALRLLGCSKNSIGVMLYPEQHKIEVARKSGRKFVDDHLDNISIEQSTMKHSDACNIVRLQVLSFTHLKEMFRKLLSGPTSSLFGTKI